jgi:ABC-type antimicrobial peptide transport system permease subunit
VSQRQREIGLRRAAGARSRHRGTVLTESMIVSLGGGIVGVIAGIRWHSASLDLASPTSQVTWMPFAAAVAASVVVASWPERTCS